mgnify:CR=1 FL=1
MNVSLQNIDKVSAQLTVKLEKADYQEKVDKSLKSFRQKAQMPGFRKGMVPMSLVKKMYGKSVIAEEVNSFYRGGLMPEVDKSATCLVNTKVKEIITTGVLCEKDGEEMIVEADTVVCALGFRSPYDKVDELADLVEEYYVIGDCKKVGKIYDAMNTGYYSALLV